VGGRVTCPECDRVGMTVLSPVLHRSDPSVGIDDLVSSFVLDKNTVIWECSCGAMATTIISGCYYEDLVRDGTISIVDHE